MSNHLQEFQRRLVPLTHLSEKLLHSEDLKPGDIHSIISRFPPVQSDPGQGNSWAKLKSALPIRSKTALTSGSIGKQLDLYFVEDREEFIKVLKAFMENYVAFKGWVEVALRSSENKTTNKDQDHKRCSSDSDTSESDSSERIHKMLVPNCKQNN
ncbi:uncharacterized protein MELLADRAFT_106446 [Melampsora larici-populina 98AG31]|uniref:Uncharacterized protein n=1 Tax=Melampsora larici-populina (strain 98AG31 / pathotype 3-4-7) TaxID=747676 RepID=F4R8L3_MELLP|nr:uncharacterized protein MELLADRAFT_102919 [Melampsora larici-populina 98AG31]XP_007410184.1 uncharacterized protein MELLADRAFT_106446 [Melampsora larici-populina 98AG31]EGG06744.1 hypothetical protein MELLADRAFT_106446 [Melampsora larici-populina 98AG31]EGG11038.1 hypothetical protein MELLADRAFT_102919 [Melampsora larici-populina 98AG31]